MPSRSRCEYTEDHRLLCRVLRSMAEDRSAARQRYTANGLRCDWKDSPTAADEAKVQLNIVNKHSKHCPRDIKLSSGPLLLLPLPFAWARRRLSHSRCPKQCTYPTAERGIEDAVGENPCCVGHTSLEALYNRSPLYPSQSVPPFTQHFPTIPHLPFHR